MNKKQVQATLAQLNLKPKKSLGQNFLINPSILSKIVSEANLSKEDIIVEVGTGLGALTIELSSRVKKIYSYEIDFKLFRYASKNLSFLNNIKLIHEDILRADLPYHNKIVSNIPYTITGPLFEKIFYNDRPPEGVLIIEKSIADRIFNLEIYKKFSRISVTFNAFMKPLKKLNISPKSFYPQPKVELSLIKVKAREKVNPFLLEKEKRSFFLDFIAGIMPYKNKNIVNALELYLKNRTSILIPKIELLVFMKDNNIKDTKLFELNVDDLVELSAKTFNFLKQKVN
ncbi:MAG: 16S rRNA (adenine(1518)-N(6)/adenine(1519)-N(6))-dimethyltransferase RsmA [Candidatus Hodarchaeota archaeon]